MICIVFLIVFAIFLQSALSDSCFSGLSLGVCASASPLSLFYGSRCYNPRVNRLLGGALSLVETKPSRGCNEGYTSYGAFCYAVSVQDSCPIGQTRLSGTVFCTLDTPPMTTERCVYHKLKDFEDGLVREVVNDWNVIEEKAKDMYTCVLKEGKQIDVAAKNLILYPGNFTAGLLKIFQSVEQDISDFFTNSKELFDKAYTSITQCFKSSNYSHSCLTSPDHVVQVVHVGSVGGAVHPYELGNSSSLRAYPSVIRNLLVTIITDAAIVFLAPMALDAILLGIGFSIEGVIAESLAAAWHSAIAPIPKGSLFAELQSIGAIGVTWTAAAPVAIASILGVDVMLKCPCMQHPESTTMMQSSVTVSSLVQDDSNVVSTQDSALYTMIILIIFGALVMCAHHRRRKFNLRHSAASFTTPNESSPLLV